MQDFCDALCERIHLTKLDNHPRLKNDYGIKPSYVAFGLMVLGTLYFLTEYSTYWISMTCGLLFPAYLTYKCLEADELEEENEDERKFWMTYWVIYGLVEVIESIFKSVLFCLPLYNFIKLSFLVWLHNPHTRGAITLYEKTLRNILKQHEKEIDEHLMRLRRFSQHKKVFGDVIKSVKRQAVERIVS